MSNIYSRSGSLYGFDLRRNGSEVAMFLADVELEFVAELGDVALDGPSGIFRHLQLTESYG